MRLKVIACSVFLRELSLLAARAHPVLDISYVRQGLHDYPDLLQREIQGVIDQAEAEPGGHEALTEPPEDFAGIVLGFGVCSRALCGVTSRRYRLVLPRAHDCIALLLGSQCRYLQEFNAEPGTYWFSPGWVEQSTFPAGTGQDIMRRRYAARYGEENADFLIDHWRSSLSQYRRAALITWDELDRPEYHEHAQASAHAFGWRCEVLRGSEALLERVVNGEWRSDETVIAEPGETFELGTDEEVVKNVPAG
jgi:hypothetical protein